MAESTTSNANSELAPSEQDLEKLEKVESGIPESEPYHDSEDDDDTWSVFSESRHIEGPPTGALSRAASRRTDRRRSSVANGLSTIRSRVSLKSFEHPLGHVKTAPDVIVDFEGPDDPYKPINWSFRKKAITTMLYGFTTLGCTLGSSIFSPATKEVAEEFGVSTEVSTLGTALYLFGLGAGPLLWAPLSELYGRKYVVLIPAFIAGIFAFGAGAGKDIQTVMICRFFQGVFGSAPVTNTGGVLADIWSAQQRGAAIVGYSICLVGGPTLGPIIGGAICMSYLRWRWTQYITGIYIMFVFTIDILVLDETYPAALLVAKARHLRHVSGNWALHAKHEEWEFSLEEMAHKYLVRPFKLLATPICALMVLYASFCYGILYATLGAFPIEFEEVRGWNQVVGALPFLGTLLGVLLGAVVNLWNQKFYLKQLKANNGRPVPEARLPPMMLGSICFAGGLFIFAWTSDAWIFWLAPCIGIVLTGLGFFTILQASLNYLIDTFQRYSASAIAANTFLRSGIAGAFPLFITPMLHNLGIGWGISVFAFIACLMIPIPFLFYIYGRSIRAKGEWSRESTL